MDMNFNDNSSSIRLLLKKDNAITSVISRFKVFLKDNGIRTVFIRSNQNADYVLTVARLLNDDFRVFLECDLFVYRLLKKKLPENSINIELLPAFDIGLSVSELKEIVSELPVRKEPSYIFIRNNSKIIDKNHTKLIFDVIIKEAGAKNIKFYWDCGFVLCAFTENELGYFIQKGSEIQFSCPSIINVDSPLEIKVCEKLDRHVDSERVLPGMSLFSISSKFQKALKPYQSFGIYQQCNNCRYFQKTCPGGCKALVIKSFQ
ncbi:MAG TPA: hypothetical protein ENH23_02815 [candidate division Zixibacteria bacterium]|nr:hypothetical protein [candidate division Zixibacteria bacterium]